MSIDRILNMIFHVFLRKVIHRGVDAGIDYAANRGKRPAEEEDLSPDERRRAGEAKNAARKMRQGMRVARRIGRF